MYHYEQKSRPKISFIAIDWGSSNFRAYAVDETGQVRQRAKAHQGILRIQEDNFASTLKRLLGKWFNKYPEIPLLMSGMVGSRHGWQEVDFVDCPATLSDLATGVEKIANHRFERDIYVVPGLMVERTEGQLDLMRGEEVQVFGLFDSLSLQGRHIICLPGTHTKWVEIVDGVITNFYTFVTGEIASLLSRQSLLSVLMQGSQYCPEEFLRGLKVGRESEQLLSDIFSVRSQGLMGNISEIGLGSYLLGILMGNEFKSITKLFPDLKKFIVASAPWMYEMYQQASELFKLEIDYIKSDQVTVQGLYNIYNQIIKPASIVNNGNLKTAGQHR